MVNNRANNEMLKSIISIVFCNYYFVTKIGYRYSILDEILYESLKPFKWITFVEFILNQVVDVAIIDGHVAIQIRFSELVTYNTGDELKLLECRQRFISIKLIMHCVIII